jgi:hypothetical protein
VRRDRGGGGGGRRDAEKMRFPEFEDSLGATFVEPLGLKRLSICGLGAALRESSLEEAHQFLGEGVFGEVFEFAGVEEEAQARGAAVEDDVRLCW